MSSLDDYEVLINLVSVRDFAHPIWDEIDVDERVSAKFGYIMDHCIDHGHNIDDHVFLVTKKGIVIGFAQYEPTTNEIAKDIMLPITPSLMISNDTSLVDAVRIFANDSLWNGWFQEAELGEGDCPLGNRLLFVLRGNHITHVVRYEHLLGLPLRMIVFSLLISLERKIISILQQKPKVSISFLSANRLENAVNTCGFRNVKKQSNGSYPPQEILNSTTFIDRCKILLKFNQEIINLPFANKSEEKEFFRRLGNLRNDIAHGRHNEEIARDPHLLHQILNSLLHLLKALEKPLKGNLFENRKIKELIRITYAMLPTLRRTFGAHCPVALV